MYKNYSVLALLLVVFATIFMGGCGSSGSSSGPAVPVSYTTLSGTLRAPALIDPTLLASKKENLQNTDSQVRTAFNDKITVYVNGAVMPSYKIETFELRSDWPFRINNVPENANGQYRIEVTVGRINLKSMVTAGEKDDFAINLRTTAATLLADATLIPVSELLKTYPSFVYSIENELASSSRHDLANLSGTIVQDPNVVKEITSHNNTFKKMPDVNPDSKVAYLGEKNDLDGDGVDDLMIEQTEDGLRVRFYTKLSDQTSMKTKIASISMYTDQQLLADFAADPSQGLLNNGRTFDSGATELALGLYFKRSAAADLYLKLYVRSIDITNGKLNGILVEYDFVEAETTAISTGSVTIMIDGATVVDGTVAATDFLNNTTPGTGTLSFISQDKGLGCLVGNNRILSCEKGKPVLEEINAATAYGDGSNFDLDATTALKQADYDRTLEVGDVFSAYFPITSHYAVFKVKRIADDSVTVDYVVNAAANERRFK